MSSSVTIAAASASRITPAEIGIARNASRWPVRDGWTTGGRRSSISVLPCGVHHAQRAGRHRLSEQGTGVRNSVPSGGGYLHIIAADPKHLGAEIGFFAVLHTWGQIFFIIPTCIA